MILQPNISTDLSSISDRLPALLLLHDGEHQSVLALQEVTSYLYNFSNNYRLIKFEIDLLNKDHLALCRRYGILTIPTLIKIDAKQNIFLLSFSFDDSVLETFLQ